MRLMIPKSQNYYKLLKIKNERTQSSKILILVVYRTLCHSGFHQMIKKYIYIWRCTNNYSSDRTDNQISAYYLVEISKTNLNQLILFHFHEGGHEIRINHLSE